MRRTPLERLEALAEEKYGRGAAVSVDRRPAGYVVTAWAPDGVTHVKSAAMATTALAIRDLRRALT